MSAKRVYTSGGSKPVSGYHLGNASKSITAHAKPTDAVPHNKIPYSDIKRHCLKEGVLFEDPDFPAVDDSLFFSKKPPRPFVWKRPKVDISKYCYNLHLRIFFHNLDFRFTSTGSSVRARVVCSWLVSIDQSGHFWTS